MEESEIIGEYLNNVLRACQQKRTDDDVMTFGKLQNDFDRMEYVLKQDHVHEMMEFDAEFAGKSLENSKSYKENGNKLFGKKSYMSALDTYTKAVLQAPMRGEGSEKAEDLALALANRSAALLHLKRYEDCLKDIEYSLEEGYPENIRYKLYDRRGKCLMHLKQPKEAIESFQKAAEVLQLSSLDETGLTLWTNTINKQITNCHKITPEPLKEKASSEPEVMPPPHSVYTHAHHNIEVQHCEDKGRMVKAAKTVRVGDVLVGEKPFASIVFQDYCKSNCYNCHTSCKVPVPCYQCSNVIFCSKACRQEAWDAYHKVEYRYQNLLGKDWCANIGHLAIRLAIVMGYDKVKEYMLKVRDNMKEEVAPLAKGLDENGVYSEGYNAIYNMEVNMKRRLPEGLFDFHIFAIYLLKLLQRMGFFASESKITAETKMSEELLLVGAFLVKNLEVIQCNGYEITEQQHPTDFENPTPGKLGIGIYPTAALFNHNCDPNADLNFYGNRLYVRATRNLQAGEEICIDYGLVYYKDTRNSRRHQLIYRYCFDCKCRACMRDWPLWRDLEGEIPLFRCEDCGRKLRMGGELVDKTSLRCSKCNSLQNLQERVGLLQVQHDVFAGAMDHAVRGRLSDALPGLEDYLKLMQKYIVPPWRDMVSCQAAIKQCYRLMANVREY